MPLRYLGWLRICSILFISVPWFIFIGTWLRPAWAVGILLLHLYVLVRYIRGSAESPAESDAPPVLPTRDRIPANTLLIVIVVAIAWASLSGAGGIGYQNQPDWGNKNALMSDLIQRHWPVVYPDGTTINYYFALYLPASAIGHLAGWNAAQWFLYVDVAAGVILALLWIYSFSGSLGIKAVPLFVLFGGFDFLGFLLLKHRWPVPGGHIEWWDSGYQFSSITTLLFWVPQHCLAGWILSSLILDDAARMRRISYIGLFVGLCLIWSPFVTAGLVPVAIAAWVISERASLRSFANFVYWPVIAVLGLAFYWPHQQGGAINLGLATWIDHVAPHSLVKMGVFLLFEVGFYGLCIAACWKSLDRSWRAIGAIVAVGSVVWAMVPKDVAHGGFMMRSSVPILLMLFLMVVHALTLESHRRIRLALGACLVLGCGSAVQEMTRSIRRYPDTVPAARPPGGMDGLNARHRSELVMPTDSRLYRLFYRVPPPQPPDSSAG